MGCARSRLRYVHVIVQPWCVRQFRDPQEGLRPSTLGGGPGDNSRAPLSLTARDPAEIDPTFTSMMFGTSEITRPLLQRCQFRKHSSKIPRDVTTSATMYSKHVTCTRPLFIARSPNTIPQGHSTKGYQGGSANLKFEMVHGRISTVVFFLGDRSGIRPSGCGKESSLTQLDWDGGALLPAGQTPDACLLNQFLASRQRGRFSVHRKSNEKAIHLRHVKKMASPYGNIAFFA